MWFSIIKLQSVKVWIITRKSFTVTLFLFITIGAVLKQQLTNIMAKWTFSKVYFIIHVFFLCHLLAHFLVLGHHHRGIVMVVLEAAVGSALQQQPHCVHLTSATGAVQGCVPTVWLAVDITATLQQKKQKKLTDVIQNNSQSRLISAWKMTQQIDLWRGCARSDRRNEEENALNGVMKEEGDNSAHEQHIFSALII